MTPDEFYTKVTDIFMAVAALSDEQRIVIQKELEKRATELMELDEKAEEDKNVLQGVLYTICFDMLMNFDWNEVNLLLNKIKEQNKGVA